MLGVYNLILIFNFCFENIKMVFFNLKEILIIKYTLRALQQKVLHGRVGDNLSGIIHLLVSLQLSVENDCSFTSVITAAVVSNSYHFNIVGCETASDQFWDIKDICRRSFCNRSVK